MSKNSMNLQDSFLNQIRKDGNDVKLVLLDGTELSGKVRGFDNFTLILNTKEMQHLIYKHAIAQMICKKTSHRRDDHSSQQHARKKAEPEAEAKAKDPAFNKMDLSNVNLESQ